MSSLAPCVQVSIDGAPPISGLSQFIAEHDNRKMIGLRRGDYRFEPAGDWSVIVVTSLPILTTEAPLLYYRGAWYPCARTITRKDGAIDYVFLRDTKA